MRGLHHRLVSAAEVIRPDKGTPYINDEDCWLYLLEKASKAGRWPGYGAFELIVDERNAAPLIFVAQPESRYRNFSAGLKVEVPTLVLPTVYCHIPVRQRFRIVLFGEKVNLRSVLEPVAQMVRGELLVPTGEATDTMIAEMPARANEDERETVVLYFGDFDPSGNQMPVVELPLAAAPEAEFNSEPSRPLFTTDDDYVAASRGLIDYKDFNEEHE